MKFRLTRIPYYLYSLWVVWREVKFWPVLQKKVWFKKTGLILNINSWKDLLVLKEVILDNEYLRILPAQLIKQVGLVVDVGAGLGDFAIWSAFKLPGVKVLAFEPEKSYFKLLQLNLLENKADRVVPINRDFEWREVYTHSHNGLTLMKIDCEGCEYDIITLKNLNNLKR